MLSFQLAKAEVGEDEGKETELVLVIQSSVPSRRTSPILSIVGPRAQ